MTVAELRFLESVPHLLRDSNESIGEIAVALRELTAEVKQLREALGHNTDKNDEELR